VVRVRFSEISYSQFDRRHVRSAMGRAARAMANTLRQSVRGKGSGAVYTRAGRAHQASAPGQPPARFTGNLLRSMKGRASRCGYALVVSAIAPHAALLELGTRKMDPRPAFEPVFADRGLIIGLLQTAYARAITATPGQVGRPPKAVEIN
jgi:hypothetical protein